MPTLFFEITPQTTCLIWTIPFRRSSDKMIQLESILNKIIKYSRISLKLYRVQWIQKYLNRTLNRQISTPNNIKKKLNFFIKYPLTFKSRLNTNINKNGRQNNWKNSESLMKAGFPQTISNQRNFPLKISQWTRKIKFSHNSKGFKEKELKAKKQS